MQDSFDYTIVKAIITNDYSAILAEVSSSIDVNRPLLPNVEIELTEEQNSPFRSVKSVNAVVLSILFQRPEILKYFIYNYPIDFNFQYNGWTPLHFAASTKDHRCLQVLLQHEYIQKHIDAPVVNMLQKPFPLDQFTTALHIAVTNKRHAQAILLTTDLPAIEVGADGSKIKPIKDNSRNQPANASKLSAFGNSPLHIAAFLNDWDMCQIILNATDDPYIQNSNGETPIDIAKKKRFFKLAEKLAANEYKPIEELSKQYMPEEYIQDESEEKTTNEKVAELNHKIELLTGLVQQMSSQIAKIEAKDKNSSDLSICPNCGSPLNDGICPVCK